MKTSQTLLFILSVFFLLGIGWFAFPADGVTVGNLALRFPSYEEDRLGEPEALDVDAQLNNVSQSLEMSVSETLYDSLDFFRDYLVFNPNRIYLPHDDYSFFDSLFYLLDHARQDQKLYRIIHYGDSQIELDRITSVLRQRFQEMFGGSGPGMISAVMRFATVSVNQSYSGDLIRYALVSDSTSRRASHGRYGIMTQFCQASGPATVNFSTSKHTQAHEKVKEISRISLLIGNNSKSFNATLKVDGVQQETLSCDVKAGPSVLTWELPDKIERGSLSFQGSAEIYGIMLDGSYGVAVDNIALRGCSGTIFTQINKPLMEESYKLTDTRMIILQFGSNRLPSINNGNQISTYIQELDKQVKYLKEVAPQAVILFIGPADMGKSYNGKMGTRRWLPELNDSIKAMAMDNEIAYWDLFHVMGGEGSMAQYVKHHPPLGGPDHIHFTTLGAELVANHLAKSFIIYHDFYDLRQRIPEDYVAEFMSKTPEEIQQEREARKNKFLPTKYFYE